MDACVWGESQLWHQTFLFDGVISKTLHASFDSSLVKQSRKENKPRNLIGAQVILLVFSDNEKGTRTHFEGNNGVRHDK